MCASRRESNDDESELSRPIVGRPPESNTAATDRAAIEFELTTQPLARDVAAFDVNDIDGDGLSDVVVVDRSGSVRFLMNRGQGRFDVVEVSSRPTPIRVSSVALQMLARGEEFRIVVSAREGVFVSDTDAKSPHRTFTRVSSTDASGGLVFVDIEHDGDVDIIVGRFEEVLINAGNASFQANPYLDPRTRRLLAGGSGSLTLADFAGLNAMRRRSARGHRRYDGVAGHHAQ